MSSSLPIFEYEPLQTASTIRLVYLPARHNDESNDTLSLRLKHFEMQEASKRYVALSYTWGSDIHRSTIILNDKSFEVTDNLMFLLRRDRSAPFYVWIDAISLNQSDKAEKSLQIPRMREIYEGACMVHVELGPASIDEQFVVERMEPLARQLYAEMKRVQDENDGMSLLDQVRLPGEYGKPYNAKIWDNVGKFFGRSWWKRVWVMQEATAIKETRFFYGKASVSLLAVLGTNTAIHIFGTQKLWGTGPKPTTRQYNVQRLLSIQDFRRRAGNGPLLEVLELLGGLEATEPQDIVYAALNLAKDIDIKALRPNYDQTVNEVWKDVATYILSTSSDPSYLLAYCGTRYEHLEILPGLGSWIPRWDLRRPWSVLEKHYIQSDGTTIPMYNASGQRMSDCTLLWSSASQIQVQELILNTHGLEIGRIASLTEPCVTTEIQQAIDRAEKWAPSDPDVPYSSHETQLDAFLVTVTADVTGAEFNHTLTRGGKVLWDHNNKNFVSTPSGENTRQLAGIVKMRRFAKTTAGLLALVSHQAEVGDVIYVLHGASVPFVLRPRGNAFWLISECYVHGMMDGEALQSVRDGRVQVKPISII
ncbi:hypothetical protein MMC11_008145 [Xylographa trunciseda]|nr:hypothetical protein [Xylographa trunciseda]